MSVNPDFRDLFAALNAARSEFLIVGGYALAVHGAPRFTEDLDVWVKATPENAQKVWNALDAFGATFLDLTIEDLSTPGIVFQMGLPPNRIEIITVIDGVEFHEAWEHRVSSAYGDQPVMVIGIDDLIRNKEAAGRPQDRLDAQTLRRARS
jgi:Nucleotidyl transferase AbiEii toxin, Type IV TA system